MYLSTYAFVKHKKVLKQYFFNGKAISIPKSRTVGWSSIPLEEFILLYTVSLCCAYFLLLLLIQSTQHCPTDRHVRAPGLNESWVNRETDYSPGGENWMLCSASSSQITCWTQSSQAGPFKKRAYPNRMNLGFTLSPCRINEKAWL